MSADRESLAARVHDFVRESFTPHFGERTASFGTHPLWSRMRELGTELWLDTGSLEESGELWTREMSALTTNNSLLNKEVQKGIYDDLISDATDLLAGQGLSERDLVLEIAFILNARHGLRLVEEYDAFVSVEEHTDLANDLDRTVAYALRYHAVCPERFIVKIPLTPAGLLATHRLSAAGVAVNHTLGFSARQNYLAARIGKPDYVNVFLGRLNAFVAENGLGDGAFVGEKASLASQTVVRQLRDECGTATLQIGASLRSGEQIRDLAGLDVLTMPPKAAAGFLELGLAPEHLADRTEEAYEPKIEPGPDAEVAGVDALWYVSSDVVAAVEALEQQDLDMFTPDDVVGHFETHGCGDVLPRWSAEQVATSAEEGKIPKLDNWREPLGAHTIALDSLMNLAGLNAFIADQAAMDQRVTDVLAKR